MDHLMGDEIVYFLHIPKTAGTSFQYYLAQYFPGDKICPAQVQEELLQIPLHKLQEYRLFAGHFWGLQQLLEQRLALITMLREPLARAISNYKHILRDPGHHLHQRAKSGAAENLAVFPAIRNSQTRHLAGNHPQYDRRLRDEECAPLAYEVLREAKFVGVIESFDTSMAILARTFKWPAMPDLPKLNKAWSAGAEEGASCFSDSALQAFEEANQIDKEIYAYGVGLLERRCATLLGEVVQQSYEQRIAQASQPPPLLFSLSDAVPGTGWHSAENAGPNGPSFRWSGPGPIATLDLPVIPTGVKEVRFEVLNCTPQFVCKNLRLKVWGCLVTLREVQASGVGRVYVGDLAATAFAPGGKFLRLEFEVGETKTPSLLGAWLGINRSDRRRLGVAISWVEVT